MKNEQLVLYGVVPSKKNSRVVNRKTGRSFPNKAYVEWKKACLLPVREQIQDPEPFDHCAITIVFTLGDKRIRDVDNAVSSVLDMLVDYKVLNEDNWRVVSELHILAKYEKSVFKTEIWINEKRKGFFGWLVEFLTPKKH